MKPSNIEQVLIDLHKSRSLYKELQAKDEMGDLCWHDIVTVLSPARGRYLKALDLACETGYALFRKYNNENS